MPISDKQRKILAFPFTHFDALICDGAIRSGKTSLMTLAFIDDAMRRFDHQRFGICGKTVGSAIQNIIMPYLGLTYPRRVKGYSIHWSKADKILTITGNGRQNIFEVFGGKDESSFQLIQGRTLAGVLLDEVALQPRSFVEQALARCSVDGSKLWFNCNPGSPSHWFKIEWIDKAADKNALHLHFELSDNPSLSETIVRRYEGMYSGVFYDRYIRGLWVMAEGIIYPHFSECVEEPPSLPYSNIVCSMDYGTQNATAMLLWGLHRGVWHCFREYYYSGRDTQRPLTDDEYFTALCDLTRGTGCTRLIVDPSAASFITLVSRKNLMHVQPADNDVMDGIRDTATAMMRGLIRVSSDCTHTIKEAGGYVWDDKAAEDRPIKVNDHAMDAMRYFVRTMHLVVGPRQSII